MADTMSASSVSFNRIAQVYDDQRAHPADVAAQIGAAIAATAGHDARVLELGIGTGRIALPVQAAGCWVTGIDVAVDMLGVVQAKGVADLVQGDIARLPFRDETFDALLAVHVLHHLSDWRGGLTEAVRLLRPGGALIQGRDWQDPASCAGQIRSKLREVVMALQPGIRPPGAGAAMGQVLGKLGGTAEPEGIAATWTDHASPAGVLAAIAARSDAESWALSEAVLGAALEQLTAWAADVWHDLDEEQTVERRFLLTTTRFPRNQ